MNPWDGKTASFLRTVTNIIILNFLWVISSMPLFTIGPSTAAMFGVIRKWHMYKEHSVIRCYINEYRLFLKQGFLVGTSWVIVGSLLILDVFFFLQIASNLKIVFIVITALVFILYIITSSFLLPVLVHYNAKGLALIKQAFTFSFLDGKTSFAIILMWIGAGIILYYAPLAVFVIIVPVSMITFRFSLFSFEKIEKMPKIKEQFVPLEK
ncbi:YesL family protein [Halalkalibacter kiskunsagensis]|uniref:YesL family protein n=1 Tax=Halalkalibacter kiskunsagensis TaxID=1548599 RepID=A0ABV6KC93_9BACI